jgi:tripartite-type tricarboxylate transporter receptor subunit TctC
METYPNKPIQLIPRFALGGRDDRTARILDHKFGEKIIQSITLEPLPLKLQELGATAQFKCEPWGKLINTINLRTQ